jgi:hypothetical protein
MKFFLLWCLCIAIPAQAAFFDRPDYFSNKALYDEIDDIIEVIYNTEMSEKDRYLRLMVLNPALVETYQKLKIENEKELAKILKRQGLSDVEIEQKFKQRPVIDAFKIMMENDTINHTDREYSNGVRIELSFNNPGFEDFFKKLGYSHSDFMAFCKHEIHTNSDIGYPDKNPQEPPNTGVLYCGGGVNAYKMDKERRRIKMVDRFEMRLGSFGKYAFGDEVQNGFHKLIRNRAANWDYQLNGAAYLSVAFERNLKIAEGSVWGDSQPEYNIVVNGGAVAGTFASQVSGGVVINFRLLGALIDMYLGQQIPQSKIDMLRAMSFESRVKKTLCERDWGVNLFVGGGAKYVFNNQRFDASSLDFNTAHVPVVFNVKAGVMVHYKRAMFELSMTKNSPQWLNTDGFPGDISHAYSSASFTLSEDAIRDSLRWMTDKDYRNELKEKNNLRKVLRNEGIKVVYQADGSEKSFVLKCD